MYEKYKQIINGLGLNVMLTVFAILSIVLLTWYIIYLNTSKSKTMKNTVLGLIFTSLSMAIELQLILFANNIFL